jgi:hypothetical protein
MNEISEEEWLSAVAAFEKKREEIIADPNMNFRELLDIEILIKLVEGGLKICRDEKN